MAIPFIDFTKVPTVASPWENFGENILKGYQMAKEPERMAEEQRQRQLANKLRELEVGHKPREYELSDKQKILANAIHSKALEQADEKFALERDYKRAQIEKLKNALAGNGSINLRPSGSVANALYINELENRLGKDNPIVMEAKEAHELEKEARRTNISSKKSYANSLAFRNLPPDEKKKQIALTTGMGLDPFEGEQLLLSGKTAKDIAEEKGVDYKTVAPVYPAAGENIKQTQRRGALVKELGYLENKTTEVMKDYQNKLFGHSPKQIAEAIKGLNPKKQGQLLAARALGPELAGLRLKSMGANAGIQAIRELQHKSLSELKVFDSLVNSEAYEEMQKTLTEWLTEANNVYSNAIYDIDRLKDKNVSNKIENDPLGLR